MKRRFHLFLLTALAGCAHPPSHQPHTALAPEVGNPQLLYLKAAPHRSLYVEVDAVQGSEPSEAELGKLEAFLRQSCDKPDGITLARSSVIPRAAARGRSALSLARQYLDGPSALTNAAPPAYLYVLYYDNRLNRDPLQSPKAASVSPIRNPVPPALARTENPHVVMFPYPSMIYVDRSWLDWPGMGKYRREIPIHEAGHVLGLVRRESRVLGPHCPSDRCVMSRVSKNVKSDFTTWLKREKPKPDFCDACIAELRQSRASTNQTTMRFAGPVLVRSMPSYQVLSLPGACYLYIGDSLDTVIPEFLADWRKQRHQDGSWLNGNCDVELDRGLLAVATAKNDPVPAVRQIAARLESAMRAERERQRQDAPAARPSDAEQ